MYFRYDCTDLKGKIPKSVVKMVTAGEMLKYFDLMRVECAKEK